MMINHASEQLLPKHTWNPRCTQNFSWTHVQYDIRATAAGAQAKSPPLGSPSAHKAQRDVHATRLLCSRATSTLRSLSVRKETCSGEKTAALSRCEHTWISLPAQATRRCHGTDCCGLTLRAHLDLAPCANGHSHATDCCDRTKRCMSTALL